MFTLPILQLVKWFHQASTMRLIIHTFILVLFKSIIIAPEIKYSIDYYTDMYAIGITLMEVTSYYYH